LGNRHWRQLTTQVERHKPIDPSKRPVIFFNASTRLQGMSQNAAYSYLTSLGLRAQGVPVLHFACRAGLQRCVLGSDRDDFDQTPPCSKCIHQSESLFSKDTVEWLRLGNDATLKNLLVDLKVDELSKFSYHEQPLGFWSLNSLRWVLRRHNLMDDLTTRSFLRAFILSAWNVYYQFDEFTRRVKPQAVVVFNGMFFPEAAVRKVCLDRGIRVITHEVGVLPFTAFFTAGEATAYPLEIPDSFQLTPEMDKQLDDYLSHRFSGNFTTAGIKFWPEMNHLDEKLVEKIKQFKKMIPVFTNVIFDTSQVHANSLFSDMFEWLDLLNEMIRKHQDVLFVIRAHPDESREGKASRQSVAEWVRESGLLTCSNVVFIDSDEYISSYDLIHAALFVLVYNSTIGLEATLLGKAVLTAGKARYTQLPTTHNPRSIQEYRTMFEKLIEVENPPVPPEFQMNARRFLYIQLFIASLPFGQYLKEDSVWKGYVTLKDFTADELKPENSELINLLSKGILEGDPFLREP
jgi:hypothetical protein